MQLRRIGQNGNTVSPFTTMCISVESSELPADDIPKMAEISAPAIERLNPLDQEEGVGEDPPAAIQVEEVQARKGVGK